MKPGQIRPLYLEPRLHKQSVKQEINNHGTCLAKPLHTKQQKKCLADNLHFPTTFILNFGLHRVFEIRRGQIFGRSDRSLILDSPIVRQTFFLLFCM
jgi:hypothetical protein